MAITVKIPTQLRSATEGAAHCTVEQATTVGNALEQLCTTHSSLRERILDETGELRRFVNVYLEGEDIRFQDGLKTVVQENGTITILPAVAGGN